MADKNPKPDPLDRAGETADPTEKADVREDEKPGTPDPTRYGDWEKKGRCIDF